MIALIDNDFVHKVAEIRSISADSKVELLQRILASKSLEAKMHGLVYKYEYVDLNESNRFFDNNIITVLTQEDMFTAGSEEETYYCFIVSELYKKFFGEALSFTQEEILNNWISGSSFGEIHSLAACYVCGYGIFLSDDNDSKYLRDAIDVHFQRRITVYNRTELIEQLDQGILKKAERRAFTHSN